MPEGRRRASHCLQQAAAAQWLGAAQPLGAAQWLGTAIAPLGGLLRGPRASCRAQDAQAAQDPQDSPTTPMIMNSGRLEQSESCGGNCRPPLQLLLPPSLPPTPPPPPVPQTCDFALRLLSIDGRHNIVVGLLVVSTIACARVVKQNACLS